MKSPCSRYAVVCFMALAGIGSAASAFAQSPPASVSGREMFRVYCGSCHGTSAKGDGPLASSMTPRPADLTQIAKRSGGTFPAEQVQRIIDGRNPVKGHGGGQMPVWGDAFDKSLDGVAGAEKIRALVKHLEAIQAVP